MEWLIDGDGLKLAAGSDQLTQRYALLTIWFSTVEAWSSFSGWQTETNECTWFGINCDSGQVTQIKLVENNLVGSVPADIALLSGLTSLDVIGNRLAGSLPPSMGNFQNLKTVLLADNAYTGRLPDSLDSGLQLPTFKFGITSFPDHFPPSSAIGIA